MTCSLRDNVCTFVIMSRWIPLRMKNVSDSSCRENEEILCSVTFFVKSCRLWDNVEKNGRSIPALWPTQLPVQYVMGPSPGGKSGRDVALITHPHSPPRLRTNRSFMACHGGDSLPLCVCVCVCVRAWVWVCLLQWAYPLKWNNNNNNNKLALSFTRPWLHFLT